MSSSIPRISQCKFVVLTQTKTDSALTCHWGVHIFHKNSVFPFPMGAILVYARVGGAYARVGGQLNFKGANILWMKPWNLYALETYIHERWWYRSLVSRLTSAGDDSILKAEMSLAAFGHMNDVVAWLTSQHIQKYPHLSGLSASHWIRENQAEQSTTIKALIRLLQVWTRLC